MEPASTIIKKFGGFAIVAAICGVSLPRCYAWTWSKARGGTDGRIPQRYHATLLTEARERGLGITADFLVLGVPASMEAKADA